MTIYSLLKIVRANGIKLWQEKGQLKIKAPKGALTKEIREQIISHKAEILTFLSEASKSKNVPEIRPLKREDIGRKPLSSMQERLWAINQLNTKGVGYNVPVTFILNGKISIEILNQTFNILIARHESLRTIFPDQDGQVEQLILDSLDFAFETIDVSSFKTKKEKYRKAKDICEKEAVASFNLAKGPLVRGKVLKISAQEHIIMIDCHHIISDDWSVNVLLEEFFTIFDALNEGKEVNLPKLPIQYLDYCVWQRKQLKEGGEIDRQLDYWKRKLTGTPESLDLITDYPRPNIQNFKGASKEFTLDVALIKQLKSLAEQQGATLYMILLAIFKTLLYRYTGQEDICIGSAIANRQQEKTHGLIGMFVNTLALRTTIESKDTFIEVLNKVKATCGEAYQYQDTPFDKIVDQVKVQRNLALNPLFQIMVSQNIPLKLERENIEPFHLDRHTSKFDMTVEFTETKDGLHCVFEYCTALFKAQTIERLINNYSALCKTIAANPNANINKYDYLSKDEKHQLLIEFNQTNIEYPNKKCYHQLFIEQVKVNPDKVAVIYENEQLTYQELYEKSNTVALYLQSLGVKPDSLVAICMNRSIDMLVGLLGIFQAGGAYVPLDPSYPNDRLTYMIEHSEVKLCLTQARLEKKVKTLTTKENKINIISIDSNWSTIKKRVNELKNKNIKLKENVNANHLAYVIYTSGSTGKPKGVMIKHRALVNFLCSMSVTPGLTKDDKLLAVTTYCFDIAGLELYLPLLKGAQLRICSSKDSKDAEALKRIFNEQGTTIMQATPATWQLLFYSGWKNKENIKILVGGEALPESLKMDLVDTNSEAWNMYGPTETTIWSTCQLIKKDGDITIGYPIANTQVYILDSFNNLQPLGTSGELHIAGDGLAKGYLKLPELTKEKFVPNPFKPGTLMYKTGDLARWLGSNTIECLGRIDTQVKIRGFRIEIGEVESVLDNYQNIKECIVVDQGKGTNKKLVAFYISTKTNDDSIFHIPSEELKKHLLQFLPDYMIPATFVSLASIPQTQNGKVNRRMLQNMEIDVEKNKDYVAPNNDESNLVKIWAKVLEIKPDSIGVNDNFFDIGGNSISAVSMAASIEKATSFKFTPIDLFKYSNIRSISKYLQEKVNTDKKTQKPKIDTISEKKQVINKKSLNNPEIPEYYEDSLAIVGISCNFPEADDHWQFWQNLIDERESIHLLSEEEANQHKVSSKYLNNPDYIPLKPWMEGKELFDPEFFQISSGNAALMDPQFRQLLLHSWKAVEDAGYRCDEIEKTSVFMSASNNFYQSLGAKISSEGHVMENSEEFVSWVLSQGGTIPTMISYQLGLKGPSTFVHSNCSSSLTALYYAYQSLQSKDVDYALIGAATLSASLSLGYLQMPGMNFSSDGHCKTFDENADGMVDGEGVGVLMVKRAVDAIKDGDHIYSLLRGISINNDGSDKVGFYAPSINGQVSVIQNALEKTGINPETISYVEAHGTGTSLGDPIEVRAISEAFEKYTDKKQFCAIGSVKPNIGHLDTVSGLAGCIKLAISLYNKKLPPLINFQSPNPQIDFKNSPFYVLDREETWTKDQYPKRVAISSFGIGGTNAHAILEEYNQTDITVEEAVSLDEFMVPLSAKREDVLLEYAQNLLVFLERKNLPEIKLSDLAYTLQIGRIEMSFRVLFVVKTLDELIKKLSSFIKNENSNEYFKGEEINHKKSSESLEEDEDYLELIKHWFIKKKVKKLAQLWVNGTKLNWKSHYNKQYPNRISLPSYPFAKIHCWIDQPFSNKLSIEGKALTSAVLHPLLHSNISDFSGQSYSSLFTGKEFFLADHQINGERVFAAVTYLEMVRTAVMQATSEQFSSTMIELLDIIWIKPIIVNKETQIIINLSANENGQITYEVVSTDNDELTLHCEGVAEFKDEPSTVKLNIEQLSSEMDNGELNSNNVYTMFEELGTQYGPAYQVVRKVQMGQEQLIAELKLPKVVKSTFDEFLLHPSILDGALQASNVLFNDLNQNAEQDALPFALKSLRIISACSEDTLVWARLAEGNKLDSKIIKLDIDITDINGNVCVELRGFSFRMIAKHQNGLNNKEIQLASTVWLPNEIDTLSSQELTNTKQTVIKENYVILHELQGLNIKKFKELLPESQIIQTESKHSNMADRFNDLALTCFEKIQRIFNAKPKGKVCMQLLISNNLDQSVFTGLSGLFKTAAMENPNFYGQIIQIDEQKSIENLAQLLVENQAKSEDLLIKYLKGKRNTLQWQTIEPFKETISIPFKDQGVYLITGGLGSLGVLFTKEIIKQVANAHIILTGRSELLGTKKESLAILNSFGAIVEYKQLDINNLEQVKKVISSINKKHKSLNGVFHCAGMISDNFIIKKTQEEFSKVLMPKVNGTLNLDEACQNIDLDFMILFSSDSALGSVGQADYATANSFMDAFAAYRNQLVETKKRHGKTLAINWPLWQDGGMKIDEATLEMLIKTTGNLPMSTYNGMQAFYQSLELNYSQVLVAQKEVVKIKENLPEQKELPKLTEQKEEFNAENNSKEELEHSTVDGIDILEKTQEFLKKQFAEQFKIPPHQINPKESLETYGIDSILAINIANQLEKTFGKLSKTLLFEYQTIHDLATYFMESFDEKLNSMFAVSVNKTSKKSKQEPKAKVISEAKSDILAAKTFTVKNRNKILSQSLNKIQHKTPANDELIAIVGVSGRYPESPNIETYWENLRNGKDCIVEIPKDRWDWREYYTKDKTKDGHHYSKWGGFIEGHDEFDPKFFNISPKEAEILDPQERLFLQHAWMAIEDAGYTRATLQIPHGQNLSGQVGVYVGVMYSEYQLFGAEISQQGQRMGFANSMADIANRVSFVLNVHGPSFTIDTMCSSSLTSIHLACQDLKQGRTDMAIAGGVNVNVHPNKYLLLSSGQYISTTGYCHSFGEGGDGYIPGEGVGAVILKRLSDAKESGDYIYGVIRGSALNHGGKVNGFTVPNPQAQAAVISQVMEESNIDPNHISYIEAHGTGTALGDPIEIAALTKAFYQNNKKSTEQNKKYGFCRIGSVKSNIGHCESAAGIAAVTKVLLQMKHKKIVPSLHSKVLNPNIDFDKTPFIVNQNLFNWENPVIDGKKIPRIAGISSFGAGGANAHIIIEEYSKELTTTEQNKRLVVPISAKKPEQLIQKVLDLINFIEKEQNPIDLHALAYTLQIGREPMEERLGFIVETIDELLEKLKACAENLQEGGNNHIDGVYQGQVKRNKESILVINQDEDMRETIDKWIVRDKIEKLLDLWVKGLDLNWQKFYADVKPNRISLPTYPFAKEKYWWNDNIEGGNLTLKELVEKETETMYIHPMLHSNTSNLEQQSYSTTFTGKEMYMKNSQVEGQKILPFVAYLEMARAAIEHALPEKKEPITVALYNTVCAEPVLIEANKEVEISLFADDDEHIDFEIFSNGTNEEIIHCQGHVYLGEQDTLVKLDLTQIRSQLTTNQRLSEIQLPTTETNLNGYMMHPYLMDSALEVANSLLADFSEFYSFPSELESVKVLAPYKKKMLVWVRYNQEEQLGDNEIKLDIDLCDEEGNICVQIQGISYVSVHTESLVQEPVKLEKSISQGSKEIMILTTSNHDKENVTSKISQQVIVKKSIKKPSNIELTAPIGALSKKYTSFSGKVRVALIDVASGVSIQSYKTSEFVRLFEFGDGVFEIQINKATLSNELTKDLLQAIHIVKENELTKVLLIKGGETDFLHGDGKQHNHAIETKLYNALSTFPYPVIADMSGNASGVGYMLGAICDFMICSEQATYSFTNIQEGLYPSDSEFKLFKERFGLINAFDFAYVSTKSTGKELKEKGWNFPILPKEEIEPYIQKLIVNLVEKPQKSLQLLKKHLARNIQKIVSKLVVNKEPLKVISKNATKSKKVNITTSKNIKVETHKDNVLVLSINPITNNFSFTDYLSDLKEIVKQVKQTSTFNVIILKNDEPVIFEKTQQITIKSMLAYSNLILNTDIPFISVLDSPSKGINWLLNLCCDYTVYNEDAKYSTTEIMQNPDLVKFAGTIFTQKFEYDFGKEILLSNTEYNGLELLQRNKSLTIVEKDKTLQVAIEIAESWAKWPSEIISSWKQQHAINIQEKLNNSIEINSKIEKFKPVTAPATPVVLNTTVISASADPDGVLTVKMEDREAKNMFSDALTKGIVEIFEMIAKTPAYKVVILIGFDNYFAAGGTKEDLYAIQEGKAKFTDTKFYHLAMECKLPVIAAMHGHAIGAGWSYGMFADFILFSEESKYLSPYMNFGFTPGAGATFILPKKLGYDLARETLFKAQEISGSELKARGLRFPVLPRKQVVHTAVNMARQIAQLPREQLISVKYQLTQHLQSKIEETYDLELAMHDETFVGQSDTLSRIQNYFDKVSGETTQNVQPVINEAPSKIQVQNTEDSTTQVNKEVSNVNQQEILKNITNYLAQELHMKVNEIEDDMEFIDLGLDSITGVTWVRLINEKYQLSIEATKVYSYPTLIQFSQFLKEELMKQGGNTSKQNTEKPTVITHNKPTITKEIVKEPVQKNSTSETVSVSSVTKKIKKFLAEELHMKENEIDDDMEFIDLGLDSITGVTWVRLINEKYELSIEATKVYSYPTLNDFSKFVKEEVEKNGTVPIETQTIVHEETPVETPVVISSSNVNKISAIPVVKKLESWRKQTTSKIKLGASSKSKLEEIAIIGMSGQFPKAKNLEEFWDNISQGKDCISKIPKTRWDLDTYYSEGDPQPGKTNSEWQGSLEEFDMFDPLFFNISPTEAESMDPQQRLFLQSCWNTIENAGYNAKNLSGRKCGVYVGAATGDYQLLSRELQISAKGFTGSANSILAARISYFLNLQGPCLTIDTACSSSLVAIATACDSLINGDSNIALAGGVCVMSTPDLHIKSSQTGMLSKDGKCYTFDTRANGFVPGEGVGVIMLKKLSDAQKDQDNILGVIQGWGINQDGKTNGITAPSPKSQKRLMQDVYNKFNIDPANIQMIEAHGTGTKLGDPIEVGALVDSFDDYTQKKEYCAIGSVKSNIGHTMAAAGTAGVIKVILSLKNKQLPPTINFEKLNEHIQLSNTPFYVNDQLKDWNGSERHIAAVSSFGFSGTNAHLVIAEYQSKEKPKVAITKYPKVIIPLSARNTERLAQKANDLSDFISQKEIVNLNELAYTLQVGREEMEERVGFLVKDIEELKEKLQDYVDGNDVIDEAYYGRVNRTKEGIKFINQDNEIQNTLIDKWLKNNQIDKLLEGWVIGLSFDWNKLYNKVKPQRIELPLYPFAKERYWITTGNFNKANSNLKNTTVIHPLVHKNTSNFNQQCYTSTFSGEELFLKDHQVQLGANGSSKQKVLPGVAYLEMARAAIENALLLNSEDEALELYNIIWIQPIVVQEMKEINIALMVNDDLEIDFEIYGVENGNKVEYCQGQAFINTPNTTEKIAISILKEEMQVGQLDAKYTYEVLREMGLYYGPAHQGIKVIYQGDNQVLAELVLPDVTKNIDSNDRFVLHPSIMDSAIQALIGFTEDLNQPSNQPSIPFALDTLKITAPCTKTMYAWGRYSSNTKPNSKLTKLDIDIVDQEGNICIQIEGLAFRTLTGDEKKHHQNGTKNLVGANGNGKEYDTTFNAAHYETVLKNILDKGFTVDAAINMED